MVLNMDIEFILESIEQAIADFEYDAAQDYINELIFQVGLEETAELLERFDLYLA